MVVLAPCTALFSQAQNHTQAPSAHCLLIQCSRENTAHFPRAESPTQRHPLQLQVFLYINFLFQVLCNTGNLTTIPMNFPESTQEIVITNQNIEEIPQKSTVDF